MSAATYTHEHPVIDTAYPFTIDPNTKEVVPGSNNLKLAQHAKNSERFTFTIPGTTIEGHDMTKCNSVLIHFQNISQDISKRSLGIYEVTDLTVKEGSVTLTWLIGEEATLYAGSLIFSIHFGCTDEKGNVVYNFPTLTFSKITVGATVWNSETIAQEHPDIIVEFESRIEALEYKLENWTVDGVPALEVQTDGKGNVILKNVPTATDDQIVESGTVNGWDYIKLKSGYAQCFRTATATVKTTDWKDSGMMSFPLLDSFGLFWTKEMVNGKDIQFPYPFSFVDHPSEVACMTNSTMWFPLQLISTSSGSKEKTDSYRLCTYKVPDKDIKVTLSFAVSGKWQ